MKNVDFKMLSCGSEVSILKKVLENLITKQTKLDGDGSITQ